MKYVAVAIGFDPRANRPGAKEKSRISISTRPL